jgi:ribose 5-phosphate isomerase A
MLCLFVAVHLERAGGGGCQLEEKLVASSASKFVIIADHRKQADVLGTKWTKGIPLEVAPSAHRLVCKLVTRMGGVPTLRMASRKAGPVVTDGGHFVVDAVFGEVSDPSTLDAQLQAIPGILETGLFCGMASHAYFGQADGSVQEWTNSTNRTIAAVKA